MWFEKERKMQIEENPTIFKWNVEGVFLNLSSTLLFLCYATKKGIQTRNVF